MKTITITKKNHPSQIRKLCFTIRSVYKNKSDLYVIYRCRTRIYDLTGELIESSGGRTWESEFYEIKDDSITFYGRIYPLENFHT